MKYLLTFLAPLGKVLLLPLTPDSSIGYSR